MKKIAPSAGGLLLLSLGCAYVLAGCANTASGPAPIVDRNASRMPAPGTAAPASLPAEAGVHVVQRGDTLYSIARQYGQDPKNIIVWNRLENPNAIAPGQRVRVTAPGTGAAAAGGSAGTPGVEIKPIAPLGGIESRPLGASGDQPGVPAEPAATAAIEAKPAVGASTSVKREPRGGKQPYSAQAWDTLQAGGDGASSGNAAVPAPMSPVQPGKPESKAEPATGGDAKPAEVKVEPRPIESGMEWAWPTNGKLVANFNDSTSKGIDIGGKLGDPVLAAAAGRVLYAGQDLRGYGKLVVVKHTNQYLSVYAHNSAILVKEGQTVSRGQKIAELGSSDASEPKLHFEIRRQGKPVDPLQYLPSR